MILAIDPGPEQSAYVRFDGGKVCGFGKLPNGEFIADQARWYGQNKSYRCVIEMIASYGMPVGAEVFETCVWIGRFIEAFGPDRCDRIPRIQVKNHLCHSSRANDGNIRRALMDKFGGDSSIKKGGPLYGIHGDCWAALAVAITWADKQELARRIV